MLILNNFSMLFEAGEFKVSSELTEGSISINPILLDILVTNLIKNAVIITNDSVDNCVVSCGL